MERLLNKQGLKVINVESGKFAQQLRTLVTLAEDLGSVPSIHRIT